MLLGLLLDVVDSLAELAAHRLLDLAGVRENTLLDVGHVVRGC